MNLGSLIFGAFVIGIVVVGSVMILANSSATTTVDTYGNTYDASHNSTQLAADNLTSVGAGVGGSAILVIAMLCIFAGVGILILMSKKY